MHKYVSFNGEVLAIPNAQISAVSSAALYGRGIFTTCAIFNRKPFLWTLHHQRLISNAQSINLNLNDVSFERLENALCELIEINRVERGRARISIFDLSNSSLWQFEDTVKTAVLIATAELRDAPKNNLRLTLSSYNVNRSSPLAGVKSCNYLENLLAFDEAKKKGFDEALRQNHEGDFASACFANVFWVKRRKIFTPHVALGGINGTTRQLIFELAQKLNFEVGETTGNFLKDKPDEVFLTSAGLGICPAVSFEHLGKQYFDVSSDSVVYKLQQAFQEYQNR